MSRKARPEPPSPDEEEDDYEDAGMAELSGEESGEMEEFSGDMLMGDDDGDYDDDVSASDEEDGAAPGAARAPGAQLNMNELALASAETSDAAILQLEVNELLTEIQLDYSAANVVVEALLQKLQKALAGIQPQEVSIDLAKGFVQQLGVELEGSVPVGAPSSVVQVGSFASRTAALPSPVVDVAVEMPADIFHKKAYLNHRYHARRALYLAALAQHLSTFPAFASQTLTFLHQDPRKPALLIKTGVSLSGSKKDAASKGGTVLRLLPCLSPAVFALHKLDPTHNAVRSHAKQAPGKAGAGGGASRGGNAAKDDDDAQQELLALPTPHYNASVVEDVLLPLHARHMKTLLASHSLRDGLLLLKVWARQQGLAAAPPSGSGPSGSGPSGSGPSGSGLMGPEGLSGHLLAVLVAHVAERNKLAAVMTPLQLMRAALQVLAEPAGSPNSMAIPAGSSSAGSSSKSAGGLAMAHCAAKLGLPNPPALAAWRTPSHPSASLLAASAPASAPSTAPAPSPPAAVLVDFTGWSNAASHMTRGSLARVQLVARRTLDMLARPADADEAFTAAFLTKAPGPAAYDYVWRIALPTPLPEPLPAPSSSGKGKGGDGKTRKERGGAAASASEDGADKPCSICADRAIWKEQEARIETLLRTALAGRAKLIHARGRPLLPPSPSSSSPSSPAALLALGLPHPSPSSPAPAALGAGRGMSEVWVGAVLDPMAATRQVDVGPAADDSKASARFRAFWGPKSELRRFQDGKISEALVWDAPPSARHTIPDAIVQYAVSRHLPGAYVAACSGALDAALAPRGAPLPYSADTAAFRSIETALEKLTKQLRGLTTLVLKVVGVQPLGATSRGTVAFPPQPHPLAGGPELPPGSKLPRCIAPVEVLVSLEGSGRWPDQPAAFRKMKAALGLQMAQALTSTYSHATQASEDAIDVLVDGFAFRLVLYSGRDEAMLTKALAAGVTSTTNPAINGPAAAAALRAGAEGLPLPGEAPPMVKPVSAEENPLIASWHHGLVSNVAGVHAAYAATVRLAQRWVACQLMSGQLTPQAVELLVAAIFAQPSALPAPGSRMSGFARFLDLLARWPWAAQPLVVDPTGELKEPQRREILRRFAARRKAAQAAQAAAGGSSDAASAAAAAAAAVAAGAGAAAPAPAMYLVTPKDWDSSNWTVEHPTPLALQRLSALAAASSSSLQRLIAPAPASGAELPPHLAHLHDFGDGFVTNPLEPGGAAADASPAAAAAVAGASVEVASKAWLGAAFEARGVAEDFDVLLLLRKEALPLADCALRLHPTGSVALPGVGSDAAGAGEGDALSPVLDAPGPLEPPPKRARAFLRAFPEQALQGKGAMSRLQPELLVGFDPIPALLAALNEHFGHVATFCADGLGGRVVGLKWRAEAFLPSPLRMATAHTVLVASSMVGGAPPAGKAAGKASGKAAGKGASRIAGLALPNVVQVLGEVASMGEGLIERVVMPPSASRVLHH